MILTALLAVAVVQEPDLSTPEKTFAAWKGIMERLHKSEAEWIAGARKVVALRAEGKTERLRKRLAREEAGPGERRAAFESATRSFSEPKMDETGDVVTLDFSEETIVRWKEEGKDREDKRTRGLRLHLDRGRGAWRVRLLEEQCGICRGKGACGLCDGKGADCTSCTGTGRCAVCDGLKFKAVHFGIGGAVIGEGDLKPPADRSSAKAGLAAFVENEAVIAASIARLRLAFVELAAKELKAVLTPDAVKQHRERLDNEIKRGMELWEKRTPSIESFDLQGETAVAVVSSTVLDGGKRRVTLKRTGGAWLVDAEQSPCFTCAASGRCGFCKGKGCDSCKAGTCGGCLGTTWAQEPWPGISKRDLEVLAAELTPLVEKATGAKMEKAPILRVSTAAEVEKILAGELEPQMKIQFPQAAKAQQQQMAAQTAGALAKALLAKYEPESNTVHVIEGNFESLSKAANNRRMLEEEYLRVVVMHELVHASDEQRFKAVSNFAAVKSVDDLHVLNALVEGHAQFVTHAILAGEKREELFQAFEKQITALPEGLSEGEKLLTRVMMSGMKFAYIDGEKFFQQLAATGKKTFVEDVFAKPPAKRRTILHAKEYYDPSLAPVARELKGLWKALEEGLDEDWAATVQGFGASEFEANSAGFVAKAASDAVALTIVGGEAWVLQPKAAPGSKMIIVIAVQLESEEAAKNAYELACAISKAKDVKLKEGAIRITSAEYGTVKGDAFDRNTTSSKVLKAGSEEVGLRDCVGQVGRIMLHVVHSNTGEEAAAVEKTAVKAAEWLRQK